MLNPISILNDINLAAQAVEKVRLAMPQIAKLVNDVRQLSADKNDPVKASADLALVLSDVEADLAILASLFPPPTPAAAPSTLPSPQAA